MVSPRHLPRSVLSPSNSIERSISSLLVPLQSSIGTGYDLSTSTYSPDGRIFQVSFPPLSPPPYTLSQPRVVSQVEYANKAVENAGTVIGLRCKDGVVLAVEKLVQSKLLVPGANRRIATIDLHAGVVSFHFPR